MIGVSAEIVPVNVVNHPSIVVETTLLERLGSPEPSGIVVTVIVVTPPLIVRVIGTIDETGSNGTVVVTCGSVVTTVLVISLGITVPDI